MKQFQEVVSVVDGSFPDRFRMLVRNYLKMVNKGTVTVTIRPNGRKRSTNQNAYYWGKIVSMIQIEQGTLDKNEVHNDLKAKAAETLPWMYEDHINIVTGEVTTKIRSTTTFNTGEMEEYEEVCRRIALEFLNLVIPLPNEV